MFVQVSIYGIGRLPYYHKDPLTFDPERFNSTSGRRLQKVYLEYSAPFCSIKSCSHYRPCSHCGSYFHDWPCSTLKFEYNTFFFVFLQTINVYLLSLFVGSHELS